MSALKPVKTIYGDWSVRFAEVWSELENAVSSRFAGQIISIERPTEVATDLPIYTLSRVNAHAVLGFLKEQCSYNFLTDYTAVDEGAEETSSQRFKLVIHLLNMKNRGRIRVKIPLAENESFPTLIPLWPGANWAEREIFDMFGIRFDGHPDLRRILMDQRWEGHPLRKDYPLRGYQVFITPEPIDPELLK